MADTDPGEQSIEERIAAAIEAHEAAKAKEAKRTKEPKNFAEATDRIAERVLELLDDRAAARRKADDDADEEPDRGAKPQGGVLRSLLGGGGT